MVLPTFSAVGFSGLEQFDPFTVVFMSGGFSNRYVTPLTNLCGVLEKTLLYLC